MPHAVGSSALALDLLSSRANNVKGGRRNSSSQGASWRVKLSPETANPQSRPTSD